MVHVCPLKHELQLINYEANYGCNGCKEPGFGPRYRCELCNYDLHKECMFTNDTCRHDFFRDATFVFMEHPPISPPTITCFLCNACRKPIMASFITARTRILICTLAVEALELNWLLMIRHFGSATRYILIACGAIRENLMMLSLVTGGLMFPSVTVITSMSTVRWRWSFSV